MCPDEVRFRRRHLEMRETVLIFLLFITLVLPAGWIAAQPPTTREFRPRRVVPPRKPIVAAPAIAAAEVTDQITDEELVLGVVIGDQARAYPINMLTGPSREIINDSLGGKAIAATW